MSRVPVRSAVALLALAAAAACSDAAGPPDGGPEPPPAPPTTGLAPDAAAALAWIDANAAPIARFDPEGSDDDLRPLLAMVEGARIVGMGEGTHGTREFVQLRDRMVRLLARTGGVRAVAVEAPLAEGIALDRYVRTGQGDPRVLLSRLHFWVTNTREMLAAVEWMRAHNAGRPREEQVGFFGVDMQYPGAAIDSVTAYARRLSPGLGAFVAERYGCLRDYRNDARGRSAARYDQAPADVRARCRAAVRDAYDSLAARRDAALAAPQEHDLMLRLARVVVQFEDVYAAGSTAARDAYMAENALWALRRLGAGARLALWAHNYHAGAPGPTTGKHLADSLGPSGYVAIATAFDEGTLTARPTATDPPAVLAVPPAPDGTFEAVFRRARHPAFLADLRRIPVGIGRSWLNGRTPLRSVGALYDPRTALAHFEPTALISDYGIVAFVRRAEATTVLPFDYGPTR